MDDRTARLECLKLAVAVTPLSYYDGDARAKAVENIASSFYNHISSGSASTAPGLTARADKQESGPAKKR
jgi:hypothetical protein